MNAVEKRWALIKAERKRQNPNTEKIARLEKDMMKIARNYYKGIEK